MAFSSRERSNCTPITHNYMAIGVKPSTRPTDWPPSPYSSPSLRTPIRPTANSNTSLTHSRISLIEVLDKQFVLFRPQLKTFTDWDRLISSNQISSNQVSSNQISSNQISSNQVSSNQISSNQVSSNQISSNADFVESDFVECRFRRMQNSSNADFVE